MSSEETMSCIPVNINTPFTAAFSLVCVFDEQYPALVRDSMIFQRDAEIKILLAILTTGGQSNKRSQSSLRHRTENPLFLGIVLR